MRRLIGLILVGLGVMFIGLAIALPQYVYPRVAKVPANPDQEVVAEGNDISVLVPSLVARGEDGRLDGQRAISVTRVVGQEPPDGRELPAGQAFYRTASEARIENPDVAPEDSLMTAYVEGGSFDGFTGNATNCCGDYLQTTLQDDAYAPVRHTGLQFKFPFDVQTDGDYRFWDSSIRAATPARYDGTEDVMGVRTYRFVQVIDDTVIATQDAPGRLFDLPDASVTSERVYANTRTMWIEPRTGAMIKREEQQNQRLRYEDREVPVFRGLMKVNDAAVRNNVETFGSSARALGFVTTQGPIGGWILGGLSVVGGLLLLRSAARRQEADDDWDEWDEEWDRPAAGARV